MSIFKNAAFALGTALLLVQPAVAAPIEKHAPADPQGEIEIVNIAGDVQVIAWDQEEVQVKADLGAGVDRLEFSSQGRRTLIEVVLPRGRSRSAASRVVVHAPRGSSLSVNTISANQTIKGVRGAQRLQAVSGSIRTQVWEGELEAKTVSGRIEVTGHGGKGLVRATTVSGDMRLTDVGSELDVNTVTGDMDVEMKLLARARIKTTNGDLRLTGRLAPEARVEAEAVNGDLQIWLQEPIQAEFSIETFNGDIDSCFGPAPTRTRSSAPGNELHFREGDGAARVRIKTLNGSVNLCRQ